MVRLGFFPYNLMPLTAGPTLVGELHLFEEPLTGRFTDWANAIAATEFSYFLIWKLTWVKKGEILFDAANQQQH